MSVKNNNGFSLLELVVVIVLIIVFIGLALDQLLKWRETAEQASITQHIASLRSALKLQVSSYYAQGNIKKITELVGTNPMTMAVILPDNYLGSYQNPDLAVLPQGHWFFNTSHKTLIYKLRYPENFHSNLPGISRIRLKILLVYADKNFNQQFNPGIDQIEGVRLTKLDEYSWHTGK